MNYEEAHIYKNKYENLVYKSSRQIASKPFYVKNVLIATKKTKHVLSIYLECIYNPIDNKKALENLGFLYDDLDVYVLGSFNKEENIEANFKILSLHDYLVGTEQQSQTFLEAYSLSNFNKEQAIKLYDRELRDNPTSIVALLNRGLLQYELGLKNDNNESLAKSKYDYEKAIELMSERGYASPYTTPKYYIDLINKRFSNL